MTDPRYAVLFEPIQIGPVTTKNRFYQVPHCNGSGHRYPQTMAHIRGMKAEGGWGVICTEECEIHPSSDLSGYVEMRLWDDSDIPTHRLMTEKVHQHDALAGIQLVHTGQESGNRFSRVPSLSPSGAAGAWGDPIQARAMTKKDIQNLRGWYRQAALRAKQAEYDIVYVYAGHNGPILSHFLNPRFNQRSDEYGGSLENRIRLLKEVLEETKDAIGDSCAVALRFAVHEFDNGDLRFDNEGREVVVMLAELPDLWDVNISNWTHDSLTSRFGEAGHQESYIDFVKTVTSKPVVGVGRFTSPDTMVSQIKRGVLDLIGAARPSIADPFLPNKVQQDRVDEIRECIGCNICTTGDSFSVPIRCTQNPTMGEEFRKSWHPEYIDKAGSSDKVIVIGGGPAGLECTLALAKRGYDVVLAEQGETLGGRLLVESKLPGLGEWRRVIDHRMYMISQKPNVESYLNSALTAKDIIDYDFERVVLATGAVWREDGIGRSKHQPIKRSKGAHIVGVEEILHGRKLNGHVVIYDDDYYYMANAIAEKLVQDGNTVTYITSDATVASYTNATLEYDHIMQRLLELGIEIVCNHTVVEAGEGFITAECNYTERTKTYQADSLIPVTNRNPNLCLYEALQSQIALSENTIKSVHTIGDCLTPGTIAAAVYSGHLYARQLDNPIDQLYGFKRENYQVF